MNCTVRNTAEAQIVDITITDATESVKARIPEGATLKNIIVNVSGVFDGTATLSVGTLSAKTAFVNAQSLTSVGTTAKAQWYTGAKTGEDVYFKVGGTPTGGVATVALEFYTKNNYTAQY